MSRRPPANARPIPPAPPPRDRQVGPGSVHGGVLAILREWADALMVAFVATMFFRIFMVELFKIPSGSMTPTLVGGRIANVDVNHDGREDLLLYQKGAPALAFVNDGGRLLAQPEINTDLEGVVSIERYDRILVNKMAYWFHTPRRGDIVVFKVPPVIWEKDKPIYIKRCVGLPGEVLSFDTEGHLLVGGRRLSEPEFFQSWRYIPRVAPYQATLPEASYAEAGAEARIQSIHVPQGKIYVFGDNTASSLDSRYWGGVPIDNVKGRAFFRYWPPSELKFFRGS